MASLLDAASFSVEEIPMSGSDAWILRDGFVVHRSGGFFRIIGLQWASGGSQMEQPFIDQREIGTLGFLLNNRGSRRRLLVQAKIEPGNVGGIQLAPTCQATSSNTRRVHGGSPPPLTECFIPGDKTIVYDRLNSEQGTRFFHKLNRNVLGITAGDVPCPDSHMWMDVDEVLELLDEDYMINTDARSVLVCAPWEKLVGRKPFSRCKSEFGRELMESSSSPSRNVRIDGMSAAVNAMRAASAGPKLVGLETLCGWDIGNNKIAPKGQTDTSFCVRQVKVRAIGREVPEWDQPIVDSSCEGKIYLLCGRIDGLLHFLLRASDEPGLRNKVELTPTLIVQPGSTPRADFYDFRDGVVVAQCRQSEEGGRFYRDVNHYQLIDVDDAMDVPRGFFWMTLFDIRRLLDEGGWLTNEARSALSLILRWL